jgi:hypothetical protein
MLKSFPTEREIFEHLASILSLLEIPSCTSGATAIGSRSYYAHWHKNQCGYGHFLLKLAILFKNHKNQFQSLWHHHASKLNGTLLLTIIIIMLFWEIDFGTGSEDEHYGVSVGLYLHWLYVLAYSRARLAPRFSLQWSYSGARRTAFK